MQNFSFLIINLLIFLKLLFVTPLFSQQILEANMHHLRTGDLPEWSEFKTTPQGQALSVKFSSEINHQESTLSFRQQDVKQNWQVILNENNIGTLIQDENDLRAYISVAPKTLITGENTLVIEQLNDIADDILIGEVVLNSRPVKDVLNEASVSVEIKESPSGVSIPSKITIVDAEGVLQKVGAQSNNNMAVRPGYVYTGNGKASFGLPAGDYTIYATRGFEYGVDSVSFRVKAGESIRQNLEIRREVITDGWVSSDTHIHTFTHSGHGDASIEERVITIAGEDIDLPVLTDHNKHIDLEPVAKKINLSSWFTSVTGIELTTPVGHFNIFPVEVDMPVLDHKVQNWQEVQQKVAPFQEEKAIILNHARDLHSNFQPFGEDHHISVAGMNLNKWKLPANAMEVINSGAQQTDWKQLFTDWFGMLNRGHFLTPVGSSDSHDVSRYVVGQARTYIQSTSENPGSIDVAEAVQNFKEGKVMVSFGLLAEIKINDQFGPGEMAAATDQFKVSVSVSGPAWANAEELVLYANGKELQREKIINSKKAGEKWSGSWTISKPRHDQFLVAVVHGSGRKLPFWPIAKPYQPDSPDWQPGFIGSSGTVWIDADGDGKRTSAFEYAQFLMEESKGNVPELFRMLQKYDQAVAIQVASLLFERGDDLTGPRIALELKKSSQETVKGFEAFKDELFLSQQTQR
ncbi:hypothetical protein BH23BAC1_BH23BAC1_37400 [soil metagenome]